MTSIKALVACAVLAIGAAGSVSTLAQSGATLDFDAVRRNHPMPTDAQLREAQEALRPEIDRAMKAQVTRPSMPEIPASPAQMPPRAAEGSRLPLLPPHAEKKLKVPPANGFLDPALMNRAFGAASGSPPPSADAEFKLFVSFSIPARDLKSLIESAAEARATVVFRGPADEKDMSLQRFAQKLRALGVKYNRDIEIDPPAFQKYQITEVPAYVLAERMAAAREVEGCAPAGSYARVVGNVAPEFALNVMKSRAEQKIAGLAGIQLERLRHDREKRQ
jgi:type-F conjugative transfer system pilin assembly protein TrbC